MFRWVNVACSVEEGEEEEVKRSAASFKDFLSLFSGPPV